MTISESINAFLNKFLVENVASDLVKAEFERVVRDAVPKIQKALKKHDNCKIGKSGNIDKRFDKSYTEEGYVELIKISNCKYKEVMDMVETYLIKYFSEFVDNKTDLEVGNKTYSGDYWIYIVHKGIKPSDEPKTK